MVERMKNYLNTNCGLGKYFSSRAKLLKILKKTKATHWATIPVPEFIQYLTEDLKKLGIKTEEAA